MMLNKNTMRILAGALLVTLLVSIIVFCLRGTLMPADSNIKAKVYPRIAKLADTVFYTDSTPDIVSYRWDFGDNSFDTVQNGHHKYAQPGNYLVSLKVTNAKNNVYKDSFFVRVEGSGYTYTQQDSVFKIVAQAEAIQGEEVLFRVDGYGSDEFNWDFGDNSGSVTTTLSAVKHTFKKAGIYTIKLYTKNNAVPAEKRIVIAQEFDATDTSGISLAANDRMAGAGQDFQERLQNIADGKNFDDNYRQLLKYVCNNHNVYVTVNSRSIQLYKYCQDLRYTTKVLIQSVQLVYDNANKCVVSANIAQGLK
jgi:hypothetical protein